MSGNGKDVIENMYITLHNNIQYCTVAYNSYNEHQTSKTSKEDVIMCHGYGKFRLFMSDNEQTLINYYRRKI